VAHRGSGSSRKAAQGVRRCEPAAELDTVLAGRPTWGLSGFLDPLNRRVESLQRCYGGQETQSGPGGMELRRRNHLPAAACAAKRVGCGC